MNKTELEKLSRQELIKACMDIKRISEQKTEIIRGLEGCTCDKSDRVNYGRFDQCLDCGLPMSGWWKPERLKFESVDDENGFA